MSTQTLSNLEDRLEDVFSYIREGRILDTITEMVGASNPLRGVHEAAARKISISTQ